MEYYKYTFSTGEETYIGTVENQIHRTNDAVIIDNHLYIYEICKTDMEDGNTARLLDIDLTNNTVSEVFSQKDGFMYNAMTDAGDKILMTDILESESFLKQYDTKTKQTDTLMSFKFDVPSMTGEEIRDISCDGETISLLILEMEAEVNVSLRVDIYDMDMNFLSSVDVSSVQEEQNNLRQGTANFFVSNSYFYYEDFGVARFLGKIENDTLSQLIETGMYFTKGYNTVQDSGRDIFCEIYSQGNNLIYSLDTDSGLLKTAEFYAHDDERYELRSISSDADSNLLITMGYKDPDTNEALPYRMYYINESELEFKEYVPASES